MLKDVTLGQFFPGSTPIHKLDPRTKLVLVIVYIVALFLAKWFVSYVVVAAFLAMVIAMEPDVLILDEPTAGLDPAGRESILENIRAYQAAQHAAVVMVSHSMEEIASNVDRLIVMEKGTAVMNGAPSEVFSHAAELVAMGLNVPCMTQVLLQLQQLGVAVPASAYTVEQAADLLAPLLKGGRPTC